MKPGALPPDLTHFVGRRHEVAEVVDAVRASRLVTLTGPGGVGKTRLGTEVARRLATEFGGGVALVELADVTDPDRVPVAVAAALGSRGDSTDSLFDDLGERTGARPVLLLLDNCEHLSSACGRLASSIMRRAPHVSILATSREPLEVLGELTWSVPPLALPDGSTTATPAGDAIDLFLERARSALPGFAPSGDELRLVAELCRLLDGIPLAIELAAVRIRSLSVEQILSHKVALFDVLNRGNRGGPSRHQTLRAAISWSYELCSEPERSLWARLAVFSGSFDLRAAQQVCAGDGLTPDGVMTVLGDLIEKSVVTRTGPGSGRRYRLLESIRMFGLERCGSIDVLRRRHRDYYFRLAEASEQDSQGAEQFETARRLDGELGNIGAALDHSLDSSGERLLGLRMAGALWFYWNACGHLQDGCQWLRRCLAENPEPSPERAKALWVLGWYEMLQGNNAAAKRHLDEGRTLAGKIGDEAAAVRAIQFRGTVEQIDGRFDDALILLETARQGHEKSARPSALSILCSAQLAFVYCLTGDVDRARRISETALSDGGLLGERWATSWALWVRGLAEQLDGDVPASVDSLRTSVELKRSLSDWLGAATCVEVLAWNAVDTGDPARAATLLGIGRMLCAAMGGTSPLFGASALIETREKYATLVRGQIGDDRFDLAFQAGLTMAPPAAIAFTLGERTAPPAEPPSAAETLTAREFEISRLIAAGLSNNDIARQLTISRRTVEGHVNRILGKLGFRSRSQVAVWAVRRAADRPTPPVSARER